MTLRTEEQFRTVVAQGLTLRESLRFGRCHRRKNALGIDDHKRVQFWRSWFGNGGDGAWSRFLEVCQLSERELIRLRNACDLRAGGPSWINRLRRIWLHAERCDLKPSVHKTITENMAAPIVNLAWRDLSPRLRMISVRLFSPQAVVVLRRSLLRRLAFTAEQAVAWERMAALSDVAVAMGIKSKQAFQEYFFARGLSQQLLNLFASYPALARLWAVQVEVWSRFIEDFARHAVCFALQAGSKRNYRYLIADIMPDISDPHGGNRTAMKVCFSSGSQFFYKPRSGRYEYNWFALLTWLNHQGFSTSFRILNVQCGSDHCWTECVDGEPPRNRMQVQKYYFRLGALMYLVHLLRGVDFHAANLVVAGAQPVIVDCETLLHPTTCLPQFARAEEGSILRTGFLPLAIRSESGVTRRDSRSSQTNTAIPAVHAHSWNLGSFVEQIVAGFSAMHIFLRTNVSRMKHVESVLTQFQKVPSRRIYRPSHDYYRLLEQSLSPSLLKNGRDRSIFLFASCVGFRKSNCLLRREIDALENLDIPLFRMSPKRLRPDLSDATLANSVAIIREKLSCA